MERKPNFGRIPLVILILVQGLVSSASLPSAAEIKTAAIIFLKHVPPYCPNQEDCEPWWPPERQALILPPRYTAGQYTSILNYLVGNYYLKNSFNNIDLEFTAISNPNSNDGWFEAPHRIHEYNLGSADLLQDGATVAYNTIGAALDEYDYLVVMHNFHGRSGHACGAGGPPDFGPVDCFFQAGAGSVSLGAAYVGENSNNQLLAAILSHELGHLIGVPDQYSEGGSDAWPAMGVWDLMGDDRAFNHFGGWSKWNRDWIPTVTDMPCQNGPCEITAVLDPLEHPGNNILRIPFVDGVFEGYMVECRHPINHDENIPEAGLLITSIDPWRPVGEAISQVVSPLGDNDFSSAALAPGETFVDEEREISINHVSIDGVNRCTVTARRGEIVAPDPAIKSGATEASPAGYNKYKSRDIWIDSQENGWDEYPMSESSSLEGGQSVPTGYGDPFWVDHENRIRFLVRNPGYGPAENVTVDVYVTQPILITIPGGTCDGPAPNHAELLETVVIDHLEAGEIYFGSVPWTPAVSEAAQVKVVIRDYQGEITHSNNSASETYARQYTMAEILDVDDIERILRIGYSDYGSISVDTDERCPYRERFRFERKLINAIEKRKWVMVFDPSQVMVTPEEAMEIPLASLPPADAQAGDCEEITVELKTLAGDVYMPMEGWTYQACVVDRAELSCSVPIEPAGTGSPVEVRGSLKPGEGGERIAIEYTGPNGESIIQNTTIRDDGSYMDEFVTDKAGNWQALVSWQGSDRSSPARSEVCSFIVGKIQPELALKMNANCRSGPGTAYEVITSGVSGAVVRVDARNTDAQWLYGNLYGAKCWVWQGAGDLNVNPWSLPERQPPPLPAEPDEIQPAPAPVIISPSGS